MKQNHRHGVGRFLIWAIITCACAFAFATPATMNYQAKLTNSSGAPITTLSNITFTFWDAVSGGNQLGDGFSDLDSVTPDSKGIVSTLIGDDPGVGIPASVFASDSVWLNVNVNGTDIVPRERISSVGYAINALPLYGKSHIIPDVTSNASANGLNLLAAIARANTLTPNGQPLSTTNRAVVLVAPGQYDIGTTEILLDAEFVDLVGLSTPRDDQHIYGQSNGVGFGVLHQTANDVHIENLLVECTRTSGGLNGNSSEPTAYFPDGSYPATVVRNCHFLGDDANAESTRLGTEYSGTYIDCAGGSDFLGGIGGTASGTFLNCQGGGNAFVGGFGTASGTFTNCTGGDVSFGGDFATASGVFTNCTGGTWSFGGFFGTASGTFTNCTGSFWAFGGYGGTASGTFTNCFGDNEAFGGKGGSAAGGRFRQCSGNVGCFTSLGTPTPLFSDCSLNGKPFLTSTPSQVVSPATDDAPYNGAMLLLAYSYAAALQPNGQPLSATNRATLIVPPGNYDLGANQLTLYAEFVDVIGQTTSRNSQYIFGTADAPTSGVLVQKVNDVRIENLLVECTRSSGGTGLSPLDRAAYFPDPISTSTAVRNCEFRADDANAWSMRFGVEYKGTFVDCKAGNYSYGGYGTASGTFTNCTGGHGSFASAGTASGTFTGCISTGDFGFGGSGTASGVFINCQGGADAFAGGSNGVVSGTFTNCTAGDRGFGYALCHASGTFTNCTAGASAFAAGLPPTFAGSAAGGKFYHCNAGANSFTTNGSPTVLYCVKNGAAYP